MIKKIKLMSKIKPISIVLIIGIGILVTIGYFLVGESEFKPYDPKIIVKNSEIYDEPIYLTFNWLVEDQIQVGSEMILEIEVRGLPYNENMTEPNIELSINEKYLNFWSEDPIDENDILPIVPFKLESDWENNVFKSQTIKFRFIVPDAIPLEYCDENLQPPCHEIPNIVHPAAYDLDERIKTNRIIIVLALVTAGLSGIIVWSRLKGD